MTEIGSGVVAHLEEALHQAGVEVLREVAPFRQARTTARTPKDFTDFVLHRVDTTFWERAGGTLSVCYV